MFAAVFKIEGMFKDTVVKTSKTEQEAMEKIIRLFDDVEV